MALRAEHVPKHGRKSVRLESEAHFIGALDQKILGLSCLRNAGKISLDIRREDRNPGAGKSLGHHLQRYGFAGSGRASDKTMPIAEPQRQPCLPFTLANENLLVGISDLAV